MINTTLTNEEYDYIKNASFIPITLSKQIIISEYISGKIRLLIPTDVADNMRDLFGIQLQIAGFDENYNPTKEGEILEDLIDKFYS